MMSLKEKPQPGRVNEENLPHINKKGLNKIYQKRKSQQAKNLMINEKKWLQMGIKRRTAHRG